MVADGGTVRGPGYVPRIALLGLALLSIAALVGQLVGFLPPGRTNWFEDATNWAILAGVVLVLLSTHALSSRLERSNACALESARTADGLLVAAQSLIGLHRVGEVEAVATELATSLASAPGIVRRATFYEIAGGRAVAAAEHSEIGHLMGHLMGLTWEVRDNPIVETALREGRAVAGPVDGLALSPELEAVVGENGITHAAAIPVFADAHAFGALTLASCGAEVPPELLDVLTGLVHIVELSLTNALASERAEELAQTEPITGLLNRRGLEQVVAKMRGRRPFAVLAFEVEGLTTVHEGNGHHAGDELVRCFAEVARSQMRRSDALARVGGGEFLAVLFDAVQVNAEALAFRVLNAAGEQAVAGLPIRASIGIATGEPSAVFDDVVQDGEARLIAAKRDGGGRFFAGADAAHGRPEHD